MAKSYLYAGIGARLADAGAVAVTLMLGIAFLLTVDSAYAQKKAPDKKAPASAPTSTPQNSWVKLCDKLPVAGKDKDGKEQKKELDVCQTLTESIDARSGMVITSVGLNQVKLDGEQKNILRMIVPLGVVLPTGAGLTFLPKDLWAKVQKNEKLEKAEGEKLKTLKIPYLFCNAVGCHLEAEASAEVMSSMKGSAGFVITTTHMPGARLDYRIPLAGFNEAMAGPATDTKKYAEARVQLFKDIAARRAEMLTEMKKQQEDLNKMQPNVAPSPEKGKPAARK